jgi:hypothetical protein
MVAVAVESRIEHVTVYASGARIRRVARVAAPIPDVVRFVDLPLVLVDDSVRAEVDGAAIVTAVRSEVTAGEPAPERSAELAAALRRVAIIEADLARASQALQALANAALVAADPTDDAPAPWHDVVAARRALAATHGERDRALRDRLASANRELVAARREHDAIAERDRRGGTARPARAHEPRKHVELALAPAITSGTLEIHLEYLVPVARWAPSYVARFDGDRVRIEMRAVVAQTSGEDWTATSLRVSTAEPELFAELPELAAQRIGRRQPSPARRGFRPPPDGSDALFADYDRAFPSAGKRFTADSVFDDSTYEGRAPEPPPPPASKPAPMIDRGGAPAPGAALSNEVWDEESSRARPFDKARLDHALDERKRASTAAEPPSVPRLDYTSLVMAMPSSAQRGRLVPAPAPVDPEVTRRIARATTALGALALPPGCAARWAHTYDYAFTADGKVDVRSDGAWHSLPITTASSTATIRHVAVPREQLDVFRVATLANPLAGPLLAGPVDVYDRGQFLLASTLDFAPPGGAVDVALGVDGAVKIARNTEFREEATGMLRGALRLVHAITIEIENLTGRSIELDVRERMPVTRDGDDDVEVIAGKIEPVWETWTPDPDAPDDDRLRGGHRWRVSVAAASKRTLRASYEVKIAGKMELVGGNRRES